MLRKLSGKEMIKGFVRDYTKIKDEFKKILYDNGFRWNKDSYRGNEFGIEGIWINYGLRLSIRARWGKANPNAIIYVEKEFFDYDSITKFFDYYILVDGMDSANIDYDLLNKGELFKKDVQKVENDKNENDKNKKKKGKLNHDTAMKLYNIGFNDQMIGDRLDITRNMIRTWREKNNLPANRTHRRSFRHSIEINVNPEGQEE